MKISKETMVTYHLDEKELTKIVLKSMRLREELIDDIVFTADTIGGLCAEEKEFVMKITMLYTDDVSGIQE